MPASVEAPVTGNKWWALWLTMRPWNLLMIVFTMIIIRERLIPADDISDGLFFLSVLAMTAAAAGGNLINDYFDIREDLINKPRKALVGRVIKRRWVLGAHHLLSATALACAGAMTWLAKDWRYVLWMAGLIALLWAYSPTFKRRFLAGNFVIALSVGQLPLWTALPSDQTSSTILLAYAVLSAAITWIRELTKDLQDIDGDTRAGFDTLPVRWRERRTLLLLKILHLAFWPLLAFAAFWLYSLCGMTWHNLLFLMPFAGATYMIFHPNVRAVSAYLKLTLGGGVAVLIWL